MKVRQLGYLIFECTPDALAGMVQVFADMIGARVNLDARERALVQLDGRSFRVRLDPGPANRLSAIGWEVDPVDMDGLVANIASWGYAVEEGAAALATDRGATHICRFTDPDGFVNELYVESQFAPAAQLDELFVCGNEANGIFGLGHLVQIVSDRVKTQDFYTQVLGFTLSDRITWPAADLYFLHCNQRHHSVALSAEAMGLKAGMIHHLMIEAKSREQVDRAWAVLQQLGFPVIMTLGQHTNDEVYSFYMLAPAGFGLEFGFGGKVVEDSESWTFTQYDSPSSWGHELQLAPPS